MEKQRPLLTASEIVCFVVGLSSVIFVAIARGMVIKNTIVSELGSGYISLTAPAINGLSPSVFYRIMHNLTVTWSLILYFLLMTLGTYLTAHTSWESRTIKLCHFGITTVHFVFVALFLISLSPPVGDMVTVFTQ